MARTSPEAPNARPDDPTASPDGIVQSAGATAVSLVGATAGYRRRVALEDVSLLIPAGVLVAVVGPNGSGKSTLLKLLLGLVAPVSGTVEVLGRAPRAARPWVGYVPQTEVGDWRFPATVGEVVMMGRYRRIGLFRRPGRADHDRVAAALAWVGMADRADDQVGELSGGQRQRVFLARALVQEPHLLLLDEPLAGVDTLTEHDVYALLRELRARGVTIVVTTHNLSTVAEHFDLALFLNRRLVAFGPTADVFTEAYLRAAYGPRMALVKINERFFAVDTGGAGDVADHAVGDHHA